MKDIIKAQDNITNMIWDDANYNGLCYVGEDLDKLLKDMESCNYSLLNIPESFVKQHTEAFLAYALKRMVKDPKEIMFVPDFIITEHLDSYVALAMEAISTDYNKISCVQKAFWAVDKDRKDDVIQQTSENLRLFANEQKNIQKERNR